MGIDRAFGGEAPMEMLCVQLAIISIFGIACAAIAAHKDVGKEEILRGI